MIIPITFTDEMRHDPGEEKNYSRKKWEIFEKFSDSIITKY